MARILVASTVGLVSAFALAATAFEVLLFGDQLWVIPLLATYAAVFLLAAGSLWGNRRATLWLGFILGLGAAAYIAGQVYARFLGLAVPSAQDVLVGVLLIMLSIGSLHGVSGRSVGGRSASPKGAE